MSDLSEVEDKAEGNDTLRRTSCVIDDRAVGRIADLGQELTGLAAKRA